LQYIHSFVDFQIDVSKTEALTANHTSEKKVNNVLVFFNQSDLRVELRANFDENSGKVTYYYHVHNIMRFRMKKTSVMS
jgi:hypothetical protein